VCFQVALLFPSADVQVYSAFHSMEIVSGSNILAVGNISNARNAVNVHYCYVLHIISCKWICTIYHTIVFHQLFSRSGTPIENRLDYLSHSEIYCSHHRSRTEENCHFVDFKFPSTWKYFFCVPFYHSMIFLQYNVESGPQYSITCCWLCVLF
jgi:hypothetical protein